MSANTKQTALEARSCSEIDTRDVKLITAMNRGMMMKIVMLDSTHWYTHSAITIENVFNSTPKLIGRFTK